VCVYFIGVLLHVELQSTLWYIVHIVESSYLC